jgi:hypothetical protein
MQLVCGCGAARACGCRYTENKRVVRLAAVRCPWALCVYCLGFGGMGSWWEKHRARSGGGRFSHHSQLLCSAFLVLLLRLRAHGCCANMGGGAPRSAQLLCRCLLHACKSRGPCAAAHGIICMFCVCGVTVDCVCIVAGPACVLGVHFFQVNEVVTEDFGNVMVVCVGATIVGSILHTADVGASVEKGDELGYFAFGGSTLLTLFPVGGCVCRMCDHVSYRPLGCVQRVCPCDTAHDCPLPPGFFSWLPSAFHLPSRLRLVDRPDWWALLTLPYSRWH